MLLWPQGWGLCNTKCGKSSPFSHLAPRMGRWGIDRVHYSKFFRSTYMALYGTGCIKQAYKVSSGDIRLKKSEVHSGT